MLWSLSLLFGCAAGGEILHRATGIPVPGTVIGMVLLFAGLCLVGRGGRPVSLPAGDGLLSYLALFFVPPGVGAVLRVASLAQSWPAVLFGILGSSVLALAITGRVAQALLLVAGPPSRRAGQRPVGARAVNAGISGLLLIGGTLLAFEAGRLLQRRLGGNALANPVLIAVLLMAGMVKLTGFSAAAYLDAVRPLELLLGPATVALALPLYRSAARIREAIMPVVVGVLTGCAVAAVSVVAIATALGAPPLLLRSIATKSVTAAISMGVAQQIGGDPQLAAALAVLTGISGAVICVRVLDLAGVRDPRARGLATGVTAHGIGTARMLAESAEAGAFSGLAMGAAGFAAGILVPIAAAVLNGFLR